MNKYFKEYEKWVTNTTCLSILDIMLILFAIFWSPNNINIDFKGAYDEPKQAIVLEKLVDEFSNYFFVIKIENRKEIITVDFEDYAVYEKNESIYLNTKPTIQKGLFKDENTTFFSSYQNSAQFIEDNIVENRNIEKQRHIIRYILVFSSILTIISSVKQIFLKKKFDKHVADTLSNLEYKKEPPIDLIDLFKTYEWSNSEKSWEIYNGKILSFTKAINYLESDFYKPGKYSSWDRLHDLAQDPNKNADIMEEQTNE